MLFLASRIEIAFELRVIHVWRIGPLTRARVLAKGERLSWPPRGGNPARRGFHLLAPLFGSGTTPAPAAMVTLRPGKGLGCRRCRSCRATHAVLVDLGSSTSAAASTASPS